MAVAVQIFLNCVPPVVLVPVSPSCGCCIEISHYYCVVHDIRHVKIQILVVFGDWSFSTQTVTLISDVSTLFTALVTWNFVVRVVFTAAKMPLAICQLLCRA